MHGVANSNKPRREKLLAGAATHRWPMILTYCQFQLKSGRISAAMAADPADKPRFNIRQPKIIRPWVGADGNRVAATVVGG
jgi:hypothetical protein